MIILPKLQDYQENARRQVIEFMGYSNAPIIADGEMRDMLNLSSDKYPILTQRPARGLFSDNNNSLHNIMAWKNKLVVIEGKNFFYDGINKGSLKTEGDKVLAAINNKVCVFPDKICYNLLTDTLEPMEASYELEIGRTTTVTSNTLLLPTTADLSAFAEKDTVVLTGFTTNTQNNTSARIVSINSGVITFPNDTFKIPDANKAQGSYTEAGRIKLTRDVPDMDFVCESNNRLWGCKGNSIYSSKLGDPKNWRDYTMMADSAYALDVGSDGDFTGCAAYPTHLLFFKEDCIHKIYGNNKPASYQLVTVNCQGLEKGSDKSIQCINGVMYYKSRAGIMAYTGDYPTLITQNFKYKYTDAVAGTDLVKYYISMKRPDGTYDYFAYDLTRRLWHREDDTHATMFTFLNGKLIYIDAGKNKVYYVLGDTPVMEDEQIKWMATFGEYDEYIENKKIYSRLQFRMEMYDESQMTIYLAFDNGPWELTCHLYTDKRRAIYLPIIPRRCDRFKLKLEGTGRTDIESIVRICREGSGI